MWLKRSLFIRSFLFASVCLLFLFPQAVPAAPSQDIFTDVSAGDVTINKQDIPDAKKKAVDLALEQAVEKAFSTLVSREAFASNLEFLYDRILPLATDFVVTYRVLEGIEHQGRYLVCVESKVDLNLMRHRLEQARILRTARDNPVVLFLIAEQGPEDDEPRYWWKSPAEPFASLAQDILTRAMTRNQIPLVGQGPSFPNPGVYDVQFSGMDDTQAALALGQALKADIVVLGTAVAGTSSNRMGDARTIEADIHLTSLDIASGKDIFQVETRATASSSVVAEGATLSLTQAASEAGEKLGSELKAYWAQSQRKENSFDLVLEGDHFLPRFIALKNRLRESRDVVDMQPKEIGSGNAVLQVQYKGSPETFADAVLLKTFEGFGLEIAEVTPEQVHIRFVDRGTPGSQEAKVQQDGLPADEVPPADQVKPTDGAKLGNGTSPMNGTGNEKQEISPEGASEEGITEKTLN